MVISWQSVWLLALLFFWAILLFGSFLIGRPDPERVHRIPRRARVLSSLILVIAGWSWYLVVLATLPDLAISGFGLLIALGMTLGFIGDLFMAGLLPLIRPPVLGGIGAFGLGHGAYIVALILYGDRMGLNAPGPRWIGWLIWLLIGGTAWFFVVWRGRNGSPSVLHRAALPYALLLSSTVGFAMGLALQSAAFGPLAIGAALFLASDLILAAQLFNNLHFPLIGDVIWLTYGPGQMLIVYTAGRILLALAP